MPQATRLDRYHAGIPVYRYVLDPSVPPVSVIRFAQEALRQVEHQPHIHDFPALLYFDRDGGPLIAGQRRQAVRAGDLYVVAPGVVIRPGEPSELAEGHGSLIFFHPEALASPWQGPLSSWRAHPLLFPFAQAPAQGERITTTGGLPRLRVPVADRPRWRQSIADIEAELVVRREGYRQAVLAHLTLLLVQVARLATDVVGDLRMNDEPLLAEVFAVIERRYAEPLSLRDVARAVNLTPGHLTTVVRHKTGRTVGDWIAERRMAEARRLLVESDRSISEISHAVGFPDPSYFARAFRREHGLTPRAWRLRSRQVHHS